MRIALGAVMIGHGSQKVFGGMQNHVHMVSSLGLPGWMAYLSAGAEFFGGILVIVGLLTRFAALAILTDMSVAIWKYIGRAACSAKAGTNSRLRWRRLDLH